MSAVATSVPPHLTDREHEIMKALVAGADMKKLGNYATVRGHIENVKRKARLPGKLYRVVLWYAATFHVAPPTV